MARFARLKVLNTMIETGMVPVFYHPELEVASEVAAACVAGGCRFWNSPTAAITPGRSSPNWSGTAPGNCPT